MESASDYMLLAFCHTIGSNFPLLVCFSSQLRLACCATAFTIKKKKNLGENLKTNGQIIKRYLACKEQYAPVV